MAHGCGGVTPMRIGGNNEARRVAARLERARTVETLTLLPSLYLDS